MWGGGGKCKLEKKLTIPKYLLKFNTNRIAVSMLFFLEI